MTVVETLEILVTIKDKASASITRVQKATSTAVKQVGGSMKSMSAAVNANKAAFLALGAAAGLGLMAFVKNSAIASALMSEFGAILGYIGDIIMMNLMPALEPLLEILWEFADWFAGAPSWLQFVISILVILIGAFLTLVPLIGIIGPAFIAGWELAGKAVSKFKDYFNDTALPALKKAFEAIKSAMSTVKDALVSAWGAIKNAVGVFKDWLSDTVVPALKTAWESIATSASKFKTFFVDNVITPISGALSGLKTWFSDTFVPALSTGWTKLSTAVLKHKRILTVMAGAAGAAFGVYMAFTSESPKMKAAFSIMAGVMAVLAASTWLATVAAVSLASALTFGIAIAAIVAGVTFGLSMLFGAKESAEAEFDMETPPDSADSTGYDEIPEFAEGGIVRSPTLALIGESGPEAVVPLDRYAGGGSTVSINIDLSGAHITDTQKLRATLMDATDRMSSELIRRGVIARPS